jgi:hypothetical protein
MAKRAPANEVAYNPLDMTLARSVVKGAGAAQVGRTAQGGLVSESLAEHPNHGPQGASNGQLIGMPKRIRKPNREKRVLLTPEEERQIERLVDHIGEQLGTSLKLSHLLRASMMVLRHAEKEILRDAEEFRPLPRPANGDGVALAQFEQTLARLLSKALRDAPVMRS